MDIILLSESLSLSFLLIFVRRIVSKPSPKLISLIRKSFIKLHFQHIFIALHLFVINKITFIKILRIIKVLLNIFIGSQNSILCLTWSPCQTVRNYFVCESIDNSICRYVVFLNMRRDIVPLMSKVIVHKTHTGKQVSVLWEILFCEHLIVLILSLILGER